MDSTAYNRRIRIRAFGGYYPLSSERKNMQNYIILTDSGTDFTEELVKGRYYDSIYVK